MYLNTDDLRKGMRSEVLDTLTRKQDSVAEQAIREAEHEVMGYLSARYDIATELAKTPPAGGQPDSRATMVVKLVRDIAIYNIHNFTAPVNIPDNRVKAYENAVSILKAAQAEKTAIVGLDRLHTAEGGTVTSSYVHFGGNQKRQNHM